MGVKQNTKSSVPLWKPVLAVSLFVLIVVGAFFLVLYFANKPNYRDLQREYNKLSLPADWKLVSESSNKGTLGLFCFQLDTVCPAIYSQYKDVTKVSAKKDLSTIDNIINNSSFSTKKSRLENCNNSAGSNYYCEIDGSRQKLGVIISVGLNKTGEKIWGISLGPKNGFAIQ